MARFSSTKDQAVSLFPMFNILVCTLGVLIFILITIVVISLGVGKTILFVLDAPGIQRHQKKPIYAEWNGTDFILYQSMEKINIAFNLKDFETYDNVYAYIDKKIAGSPLETVLNDIVADSTEKYLILMVRPSGFDNFGVIKGYIQSKKIDIGYEPIDQEWNIQVKDIDQ